MTGGRRAVVTGCGVQSPVGLGVPQLWNALVEGKGALRPIERFAAADLAPNVAAEIAWDDGDPDRAGAFGLRAAAEALDDAGLRSGGSDGGAARRRARHDARRA